MSPVKNGECDEFSLHVRNVPVSGVVTTMMPHLKAGLHQLNIKWENGVYNKQFRLTSVRLIKVGGEDLNGNGQQDWAEQKLHVECSVSGDTESYTSPFCLEGDGRYRSMMSLSTGEDILGGSGSKWYANVALDPTEAQIIQVQFQNGAKVEERLLKWKVTHGPDQVEAVSVRAGDSLLLSPSSASFPQAGAIVVAGDRHEVSMGETRVQRFDDVGDVEVTSIQYGENGEETSSTFVVRVVDVNLPTEALAAMIGNERHMDLNSHLVEGTVYDPDPRLLAWYTNHEGQVAFAVDAHQERRVMARLGENGPILDTLKFEGLKVYGSSSTWGRVMDTLEDGTKVMSMGILVDHFPPNLEVHLRIFLAGVTLDDGSLNRVLRQEDFNDRNEAEITLLKTPEASKTAACHHIDVYQNGQFVGRAY